jgi:hypothetical protein
MEENKEKIQEILQIIYKLAEKYRYVCRNPGINEHVKANYVDHNGYDLCDSNDPKDKSKYTLEFHQQNKKLLQLTILSCYRSSLQKWEFIVTFANSNTLGRQTTPQFITSEKRKFSDSDEMIATIEGWFEEN